MTSRQSSVTAVMVRILLYFLILLACQMALGFDRGFGFSDAYKVPFMVHPDDAAAVFGGADFASYIKSAQLIPSFGLRTFYDHGYGMFPPGLPVFYALLFKLWPNPPLYAVLFFVTTALWAVFLNSFNRALHYIFNLKHLIAFAVPLSLLAFPFFLKDYLWTAVGLTEAISAPLFCIAAVEALIIMVHPARDSWRSAAVLGFIFAIASYTRAQFDFTFLGLWCASLLCLAVEWLPLRRIRPLPPQLIVRIFALLAVMLTYQLTTIPYKAVIKHAPTIVVVDYAWESVWMQRPVALKILGQSFVDEGMQSICEIDPTKCQEFADRKQAGETITLKEYKRTGLKTVLLHPLRSMAFKLPIFWKYWFVDMFEDWPQPWSYNWLIEYILFLGIPFAACYIIAVRTKAGLAFALHAAAFISACIVFSVFIHIEPRYFLPIKMFSAVSLICVAVHACRQQLAARATSKLPQDRTAEAAL